MFECSVCSSPKLPPPPMLWIHLYIYLLGILLHHLFCLHVASKLSLSALPHHVKNLLNFTKLLFKIILSPLPTPSLFLFPLPSALESAARSHPLIFRRAAAFPSFPSVLLLPLTWVIFSVRWWWHHFLVPSQE